MTIWPIIFDRQIKIPGIDCAKKKVYDILYNLCHAEKLCFDVESHV